MAKNQLFRVMVVLFLCNLYNKSLSCTVVVASNYKYTLVGNNEDFTPGTKTYLWARPAANDKFGYVFGGLKRNFLRGA